MSIICTRCDGTGFLNIHQAPEGLAEQGFDEMWHWFLSDPARQETDVLICDCCGNGDGWYGEPGRHYTGQDPSGPNGPYASNGGLCHCH